MCHVRNCGDRRRLAVLDARRLSILLAVHEHGGVAAAARSLALTPPAISQQITALERHLGIALLDRSRRSARLTPAGLRLAGHAERILSDLAAAEADLASITDTGPGIVTVGVMPSEARSVLPLALSALGSDDPPVQLCVEQLEPEHSVAAVRQGDLDLALVSDQPDVAQRRSTTLSRHELLVEPMLIAVPVAQWSGRATIRFAELHAAPWVAPSIRTAAHAVFDRSARIGGFDPIVVARTGDFDVALHLVRAGLGVALVPQMAASLFGDNVGVRYLVPERPDISRSVSAVLRRGSIASAPIARVLAALMDAASTLSGREP